MNIKLVSRRDFLKIGAGGMAAWAVGLPSWTPRMAFAPEGESPTGDVLVCIFLRGALDGLNTVIPQFDANYFQLRPTLAIPEGASGNETSAIDLDGNFGFNPALRPLVDIWEAGELAIVHAVGSPDPTHSHFDAMDYMERGTPGEKSLATGWIGRHLQTAPWHNESPFRAVGMGGIIPASLRGPVSVTTLQSIADFHLQGNTSDLAHLQQTLTSLYSLEGGLAAAAQATINAVDVLAQIDVGTYQPAHNAAYPEGEFGLGLMQVAQLIKAEVGLEVACVDLGGFDTHVDQAGRLTTLLTELGTGLSALFHDLDGSGKSYSVVTMSEFGRRAAENGNAGTDHGHGGVMFAFGSQVNGGQVYTDWPGLAPEHLYGPGDLAVTIDYRDVLAEMIAHRLGNPENVVNIFPDFEVNARGIFNTG
jgi:uncharacterized protein (DUF1501 family)